MLRRKQRKTQVAEKVIEVIQDEYRNAHKFWCRVSFQFSWLIQVYSSILYWQQGAAE